MKKFHQIVDILVAFLIVAHACLLGLKISSTSNGGGDDDYYFNPLFYTIFWLVQISVIWMRTIYNCWWNFKDSKRIRIFSILIASLASIPIDSFRVLSLSLALPLISITSRSKKVLTIFQESVPVVFWGFFMVTTSLWVLAIIYTNFLSSSTAWIFVKSTSPSYFDLDKFFGSNIASFLTMLQIMTMDHWIATIAKPLMATYPVMLVFLLSLLFIFTYGFLNVLIGLIVRCTILSEQPLSFDQQNTSHDDPIPSDQFHRLIIRQEISNLIVQIRKSVCEIL